MPSTALESVKSAVSRSDSLLAAELLEQRVSSEEAIRVSGEWTSPHATSADPILVKMGLLSGIDV
jgi:hypothetical protein